MAKIYQLAQRKNILVYAAEIFGIKLLYYLFALGSLMYVYSVCILKFIHYLFLAVFKGKAFNYSLILGSITCKNKLGFKAMLAQTVYGTNCCKKKVIKGFGIFIKTVNCLCKVCFKVSVFIDYRPVFLKLGIQFFKLLLFLNFWRGTFEYRLKKVGNTLN